MLRITSGLCALLSLGSAYYLSAITVLRVSLCDTFGPEALDPRCREWVPWEALFLGFVFATLVTLVASFCIRPRRAPAAAPP